MNPRLRLLRLRLRLWAALWPALAVVFALVADAHCAHADDAPTPLVHRLLASAGRMAPKRLAMAAVSPLVGYVLTTASLETRAADELALAFVWAAQESGGNPRAVSPNGLDHGLTQLRGPALQGHTKEDVYQHPVLAVQLWLRWLDVAKAACPGSMARALGALSTGACGGAPQLVAWRCTLAGVDCTRSAASFLPFTSNPS